MRLLKALIMGTAIMMMSQAVMADICTTSGSTITCDNGSTSYTDWIVGKDTAGNRVYACAKVLGEWELVGWENYNSHSYLEVKGCSSAETITIVETTGTTSTCDFDDESTVTAFPSNWFTQGIEVHGYRGNDIIYGSYRDEDLYGDEGYDTVTGNAGDDDIYGGDNDDTLNGITGENYIYGGGGVDTINGGDMTDFIWGGAGNDIIHGYNGVDTIRGEAGRDRIWGGSGGDYIYGGDDSDRLYGEAGDDHIWGCGDRDYMYGGADDDALDGITYETVAAFDLIYGNDDDDTLSDNAAGICDGGDHTTAPFDGCSCPEVAEVNCEY